MILWPFNRKPKKTREEYLVNKPMPPCGDKDTHYDWTELREDGFRWPCPRCAALDRLKREEEKENQLASKIASEILKQMKEQGK